MTPLVIVAEVNVRALSDLSEGMPAWVTISGRPDEPLAAVISELSYPSGSGVEAAGDDNPPIRVELLDPQGMARFEIGDRVIVTAVVEEKEDVLWMPPAAIRTFNNRKFVVIEQNNTLERVNITTGIAGADRVEIVDGLSDGQVVIGP